MKVGSRLLNNLESTLYYVLFFQYSAFAQEAMINKQIERVNLILRL